MNSNDVTRVTAEFREALRVFTEVMNMTAVDNIERKIKGLDIIKHFETQFDTIHINFKDKDSDMTIDDLYHRIEELKDQINTVLFLDLKRQNDLNNKTDENLSLKEMIKNEIRQLISV